MKILDNGVLRDMTQEEILQMEQADAEMKKQIPQNDEERATLKELINRLAEAESIEEITEIAKDIKARKNG